MFKLIASILLILSSISYAGGHGGGVLSINAEPVEMIYSKGNDGQNMNYVRATWENGKWNLKEESLVLRDFDSPIHNAIKESDLTRNWVEVKE